MANKKWAQNFLIQQEVVDSIVLAADVKNSDSILEIGPGLGILTSALLESNSEVTAIEIDPELCVRLRKRFESEKKFTLLEMDAMELSPEEFSGLIPEPAKVVTSPVDLCTLRIL